MGFSTPLTNPHYLVYLPVTDEIIEIRILYAGFFHFFNGERWHDSVDTERLLKKNKNKAIILEDWRE